MTLPPMPLPHERPLYWLHEDREVRFLTEALIAVLCLPVGILILVFLSPGGDTRIDASTTAAALLAISPLVALALMRRPTDYLLTSHRIGAVHQGRFTWSLRLDRIDKVWRLGGTLHLRAGTQRTYSVTNLRHALWLEHTLSEHSAT